MLWPTRLEGRLSASISTTDARALVDQASDAMNRRELERLDDLVADGFVRHREATPGLEASSLEEFKGVPPGRCRVVPRQRTNDVPPGR